MKSKELTAKMEQKAKKRIKTYNALRSEGKPHSVANQKAEEENRLGVRLLDWSPSLAREHRSRLGSSEPLR